jgi:hypothetical protein
MTSETVSRQHGTVEVVLEGGPADLSAAARRRRVAADEAKVKVPHHGGYEHFERTDEQRYTDGVRAVLFRWTARTRVAE